MKSMTLDEEVRDFKKAASMADISITHDDAVRAVICGRAVRKFEPQPATKPNQFSAAVGRELHAMTGGYYSAEIGDGFDQQREDVFRSIDNQRRANVEQTIGRRMTDTEWRSSRSMERKLSAMS